MSVAAIVGFLWQIARYFLEVRRSNPQPPDVKKVRKRARELVRLFEPDSDEAKAARREEIVRALVEAGEPEIMSRLVVEAEAGDAWRERKRVRIPG